MRGDPKISSIYAMGASDDTTQERLDREEARFQHTARKLYHDHGVYLQRLDNMSDDFLRQSAINDLNRRFGRPHDDK